jgi:hypothetical protein
MNTPRDKKSQEPSKEGTTEPAVPDDNRSGRITYDERGNSVWEWRLETGVYSRDISTQRLKKLDLNDLSIAETARHQRPLGLDDPAGKKAAPGGGFNPYDNSSRGGSEAGGNPYDNARNFGRKLQQPASAPPAQRKPMDLKRLEEWMEIKKRLEQQKKDEDND